MSFQQRTCIVVACDGGCDDPWDDEDGEPHFDSAEQAAEILAARGWLVTDRLAVCPRCAAKASCDMLGHQWDDWYDASQHGIQIRQRMCDRCSKLDWDPPFEELYPRFQALKDAERIVADAARTVDQP